MDYCPDTEEYCSKTAPQDIARAPTTVSRMPAVYQAILCRHVRDVDGTSERISRKG